MTSIPALAGSYALLLRLDRAAQALVGGLGQVIFPPGWYAYSGRAYGPGGLAARLGRHLAGSGRPHWHIDRLRALAVPAGYLYAVGTLQECTWAQAFLTQGGRPAVRGFGSSDCRTGCPAHLFYFSMNIPAAPAGAWTLLEEIVEPG